MDLVGTVTEQTQRLLDRGFLLSAFLPLAATVLTLWVLVAGMPSVLSTLGLLAGQPLGEAAVTAGLVFVGLYLTAFVVHGLRRTLRDLWSGAIPIRALREDLVARQYRRLARLRRRLDALGYELNSAYWLREDGLAPSAARGSDRVLVGDEAIGAAARRCERRLAELRRRSRFGAAAKARSLLLELNALAVVDPVPDQALQAIQHARDAYRGESTEDQRVADRLTTAALRIEQRRRALDDELEMTFPPEEALQATRLGNVLARTEHYSTRRYDVPLETLWPRLLIVAPDDDLELVEDALVRVDFALAMTTGGILVSLTALSLVAIGDPSYERLIAALAATLVSVGLYRFAVVAARLYGEQVAATVDLNLAALDARFMELMAGSVDRDRLYHFLARADDVEVVAEEIRGPHGEPASDDEASEP